MAVSTTSKGPSAAAAVAVLAVVLQAATALSFEKFSATRGHVGSTAATADDFGPAASAAGLGPNALVRSRRVVVEPGNAFNASEPVIEPTHAKKLAANLTKYNEEQQEKYNATKLERAKRLA